MDNALHYFFLVIVFLGLLPDQLSGQQSQPYFQSYTTEDGLGGESINDVLVDRYGYIWTAAYSGLHRFDGYDFVHYPSDLLDSCTVSHPIALKLLESPSGDLWVATSGGLNRLNRATGCFQRYYHQPDDDRSLPNNEVIDLIQDANGAVIVLTVSGAARYLPGSDDFERFALGAAPVHRLINYQGQLLSVGPQGIGTLEQPSAPLISFATGSVEAINTVLATGDSLVIGTNQGLYVWPQQDSLIRELYSRNHLLNRTSIMDILPGEAHGLKGYWVATRGNGLGFLDLPSGEGGLYEANFPRDFNLLDNHVRALAQDPLGSLWIGTYIGLNRFNVGKEQPSYYRSTENDGKDDQVLELHADNGGGIYAYRRWQGLFRSKALGRVAKNINFPRNDFLEDKDLNQIYTDRQDITWLLRGNDALYRYDGAAEKPLPAIQDSAFQNRRLNGIHQDLQDDNLYWLATSKGLGRLHLEDRRLEWWRPSEQVTGLSGNVITAFLPTEDGKIWLSAGNYYNDRIGYFDTTSHQFTFFDYHAGDPNRIAGGRIKQFAKGVDGTIWVAASQGLLAIDPTTNSSRLLTQVGEVPVGVLEAVITDKKGGVWFSGGDQIGHYLPAEESLTKITCTPIRQFGNSVATELPNGRLLFGGLGGLVMLKPEETGNNLVSFPRIVLNELRVAGKNRPTEKPLADLEVLPLKAAERNLSLRFAGLFFDRTRHIEYAYRLNGEEWQELGSDRSLSFTDLRPTTYILDIRSTDGQSNWNPELRSLIITVAPYWYETVIARVAFAILGLALLLFLGRFFVRRRLERQAHEQLQELDAFKSRLFTDLTHEFRTPLTLILGPANRLREKARVAQDETLGREARRISHQGKRLLRLINQLLDLRKLEAGQLQVDRTPTLLMPFFSRLTESFRSAAEVANQELQFSCAAAGAMAPTQAKGLPTAGGSREANGEGEIAVYLDRNKQETLLTNLLANALKFTPRGGTITVDLTIEETRWTLSVSDTGPGISREEQETIFQRFTRAHGEKVGGTGVGLALVQELTTLLGGQVELESKEEEGSTFRLIFPRLPAEVATEEASLSIDPASPLALVTSAFSREETIGYVSSTSPHKQGAKAIEQAQPLVLIVEDSQEVADYLAESIQDQYRILVAYDGEAGLATAIAEVPDLVISDVMMPRLNGLQLTARLKADTRTSHLPVLLLTAKTAEEHRLEGLDRGADAYLSKPFNERELRLRLRNLLALREATAARLRAEFVAPATAIDNTSSEAAWLNELRDYIHQRLDDPQLNGKDLEKHLGMSRSQLHRKLQSVLGLSATKLINQLRLEAAAEQLRQGNTFVSEVAYACGFSDPGYFGRKFKERFGVSPGAYGQGPF